MAAKSKGRKDQGIPGNTILEQQQFDEMVYRAGRGWISMVSALHRMERAGVVVHRVTFKGLWSGHGEVMIILVADTDEGPKVAFHSGSDPGSLPQSLATRLTGGTLKWRDDEYANK